MMTVGSKLANQWAENSSKRHTGDADLCIIVDVTHYEDVFKLKGDAENWCFPFVVLHVKTPAEAPQGTTILISPLPFSSEKY